MKRRLWAILVGVVGSVMSLGIGLAMPVDPAPISDEVVRRVLQDLKKMKANPIPSALLQHMDGTLSLLEEEETDDQEHTSLNQQQSAGFTARANRLADKVQELRGLRAEFHTRYTATRQKLVELGLPGKLKAWDTLHEKVDSRFAKRLSMLEDIGRSGTQAERRRARSKLMNELKAEKRKRLKREHAPSERVLPTMTMPPLREAPSIDVSEVQNIRLGRLPQYLADPYGHHVAKVHQDVTPLLVQTPPTIHPNAQPSCAYTGADLSHNPEVQLTSEISDLAAKLNYSPAKMYEYVSNEIRFEPYYGSLKGALGTLKAGAGNATDQASLLIALLRASNIPARYVKGRPQFENDPRILDWIGVKDYFGAQQILLQGHLPNVLRIVNGSTSIGLQFPHVWVEACVPYRNYRGTNVDPSGHRWIPLDPSFEEWDVKQGLTHTTIFDYADYLSEMTDVLPYERYQEDIMSDIRAQDSNAMLQDVGLKRTFIPRQVDILPTNLPYRVISFLDWSGPGTTEVAEVPNSHRYHFQMTVKDGSTTLLDTTVQFPDVILDRMTLSYVPATGADQAIWDAWDGDLQNLPVSIVNVNPVIKLEGVDAVVGTTTNLGSTNKLIMKLTLEDSDKTPNCPDESGGVDPDRNCINATVYENIIAGGYHALTAYAFQASDQLLMERATQLVDTVQGVPTPPTNTPFGDDNILGEFLHLSLLKYMRYISETGALIGHWDGASAHPGNHIGLTTSHLKVEFLFGLPFAVVPSSLLIDVKGGRFSVVDQTTGASNFETFKLIGHNGSAYEHFIWQEIARLDAVSTVRGLQFAQDQGISILTFANLDSASFENQWNSMDSSMAPFKDQIKNFVVNQGAVVTAPQSTISYDIPEQTETWDGAIYTVENQTAGSIGMIISGQFGGGYAAFKPAKVDRLYSVESSLPSSFRTFSNNSGAPINSTSATRGVTSFTTHAADPVNMLTGNMFHIERDLTIKGRGLPLVFERTYNSREPEDGPLGFGWTHSFNHVLTGYGVEDGHVKVSWTDGTGAERFFSLPGSSIPSPSGFQNPDGVYVTFERQPNGTYTIKEKNGLTYVFDGTVNLAGSGTKAKLQTIQDRFGNTLTLTYSGGLLSTVNDDLSRPLTFAYQNNRIHTVQDWTGRTYTYGYDGNANLQTVTNPLTKVTTYSYDDAQHPHAMTRYEMPEGNGMTFAYYANGKVLKHTNDLNETTSFTYNVFRRETIMVTPRGHVRRLFFDEQGNPIKIVEENGGIQTFAYDPSNPLNRTEEVNSLGLRTQYQYDGNGNVTMITLPSGKEIVNSHFTAFHQPGKIKDARGNYTVLKYDGVEILRMR